MVVDENLPWKGHINIFRSKASWGGGIMNQLKNIIPYSALQLVYFTLVQYHLDYKGLVYLKAFKSNLIQLSKDTKKSVLKSFLPFPPLWPNKSMAKSLHNIVDILPASLSV